MVVFIVGLSGSGKTTAADFFRAQGIPIIRLGDVTQRELEQTHTPPNEQQERQVRKRLRETEGVDVYARRTLPFLFDALQAHPVVVVEGVRSQEELAFFAQHIAPYSLVYVEARDAIRHKRLKERATRPLNDQEMAERDRWEKEDMHVESLKTPETTIIENNGTMEQLHEQLQQILKIVSKQP